MNTKQVKRIVSEDFTEMKTNHKKVLYWRHKTNKQVVLFFPVRKVIDSVCIVRTPQGLINEDASCFAVKFKCYTESELMQLIIQISDKQ